ncbi:hypothetical protein V8J88_22235 [Massilia sp. W12]|uniref:hypothetical protein n=1 Tax=Massilia sp. W12 TaxID=3126507 RepID=UPI0030D13AF5
MQKVLRQAQHERMKNRASTGSERTAKEKYSGKLSTNGWGVHKDVHNAWKNQRKSCESFVHNNADENSRSKTALKAAGSKNPAAAGVGVSQA